MGYKGQGSVVCTAAVDAAIDAMVVNVAQRSKVRWPLVLWRAMGGMGGNGGWVGQVAMADEGCWKKNSPTKNNRVDRKCSKLFCLCLLFYILGHDNLIHQIAGGLSVREGGGFGRKLVNLGNH